MCGFDRRESNGDLEFVWGTETASWDHRNEMRLKTSISWGLKSLKYYYLMERLFVECIKCISSLFSLFSEQLLCVFVSSLWIHTLAAQSAQHLNRSGPLGSQGTPDQIYPKFTASHFSKKTMIFFYLIKTKPSNS